jgi:hypothetical protein
LGGGNNNGNQVRDRNEVERKFMVEQQQHGRDKADAYQGHQERRDVARPEASLPVQLRDIKLASSRFCARFRGLWNNGKMIIQRNRFRRAGHRMMVIAAEKQLQQDHAPAIFDHDVERQLAGVSIC